MSGKLQGKRTTKHDDYLAKPNTDIPSFRVVLPPPIATDAVSQSIHGTQPPHMNRDIPLPASSSSPKQQQRDDDDDDDDDD
eukprot:CAMPEP_0196234558 /NCGR_PEP_ID=MMETSP0913-20130531/4625_1 /TAXON_ID=49265 /ORGANISM="Thalassiosira rotula, Strain GSO102" /LENGTH=80 /DNA_ID=CAMNT_0041515657 /DNA_START=123 /DNA_END=363 /DNA_ORIENTATION=-